MISAALTLLVLALFVAVLAVGHRFYVDQRDQVEQRVADELTAIAVLKGDQIARWRAERLEDAMTLPTSQPFLEHVRRWLVDAPPEQEDLISGRLGAFAARDEYGGALLVDTEGRVLLGAGDYHVELHEEALDALLEVVRTGEPVLTELHMPVDHPYPHIDAISPLVDDGEVIAALVFHVDAEDILYPLIQSWPLPSDSGESLIVSRDGDDVLFLNELRHIDDIALSLRVPLTETDVPAVRAVRGEEGVVRGTDYRGEPVIAALTSIPGSDWRLVVKVDEAEAFAAWHIERALLAILAGGIFIGTAGAVALVWQRDHAHQLAVVLEAERSRAESESRYGATLMSVGDGVIATDAHCYVTFLNPVAEALTGWSEVDASGRPLEEVLRIVNEYTREPVENPARRVMRDGMIVGLANHTLLIARDGEERPIADSGAPVRDAGGEITGTVLVFRDQSEERAAEHALRLQRDRLEQAERHGGLGSWEYEIESGRGWWSPQMCRMFGFDPACGYPGVEQYLDRIHPDDRERIAETAADLERGVLPEIGEFRTSPERGPVRTITATVRLERDEEGNPTTFAGTMLDITDRVRAEERLLRFKFMVENSTQEIYLVSREGRLEYVNEAAAASLGYTVGELLSLDMNAIDPKFGPVFATHFDELKGRGARMFYTVHVARDGRRIYKEMRSSVIEFGGEEYVCGFAQDITERKVAEDALRESEERYAQLFSNLTVGLAVHEIITDDAGVPCDYRFIQVNPAFERLTGLEAADVLGRTVLEVLPDTEPQWIERYGRVALTGEPFEFEEYARELNRYFDVLAYSPAPGKFATVFADTTDRKRAEDALRESKQMLRLVLDTIPVRVFWKNRDLVYLGCNQPFAADAGRASPDDVIGKDDFDMTWIEQAELYRSDDRAVIESGEARLGYEEPQTTPQGETIWLRTSKVPLVANDGSTIGVMGTYEDITALKEAREKLEELNRSLERMVDERTGELQATNEELQCTTEELTHMNEQLIEAGEAKSRFLRAMSHELRTPLNSIIGFSGVMLQGLAGKLTKEQRRQLEMIDNAGRHLLALINDILDLSRIEAGRIDIVMDSIDVAELAREIVGSVSAAAEAKAVELRLDVTDESIALVSDARKIRQILINLLGNALKFTDEGHVTLTIHRPTEAMVGFSVRDTGPGIAEEDQERIFGEFVQGTRVPDPELGGTGLGLAISRGLAAALGGMITVESIPGDGATFTLLLPESSVDV